MEETLPSYQDNRAEHTSVRGASRKCSREADFTEQRERQGSAKVDQLLVGVCVACHCRYVSRNKLEKGLFTQVRALSLEGLTMLKCFLKLCTTFVVLVRFHKKWAHCFH